MGCPCGCQDEVDPFVAFEPPADQYEVDPLDLELEEAFEAFDNALNAVLDVVYRKGLDDGARSVLDLSKFGVDFATAPEQETGEFTEADAIAIDAALAQIQDLALRIESLEYEVGLKYLR